MPVAADVFAQAASAYTKAGDTVSAVASAAAAAHIVGAIGGPVSPAQSSRVNPGLTRREREVVELVAQDLANAQVAERLQVSVRTVEGHLLRASAKLGASDRHAVAQRWRELA